MQQASHLKNRLNAIIRFEKDLLVTVLSEKSSLLKGKILIPYMAYEHIYMRFLP